MAILLVPSLGNSPRRTILICNRAWWLPRFFFFATGTRLQDMRRLCILWEILKQHLVNLTDSHWKLLISSIINARYNPTPLQNIIYLNSYVHILRIGVDIDGMPDRWDRLVLVTDSIRGKTRLTPTVVMPSQYLLILLPFLSLSRWRMRENIAMDEKQR